MIKMFNTPEQMWNLLNIIATLLTTLIGAWFTMQVFHGGKKADAANMQLEKVYGPLFTLVEPYLFHKMDRKQCAALVNQIEQIVLNGGYLADPMLKDLIRNFRTAKDCTPKQYNEYQHKWLYVFTETPDHYLEYWFRICNHIDRTYDKLCLICSYPLRNRSYRLDRKQYVNSFRFVFAWMIFLLPILIWFALILIILIMSALHAA